METGRGIYETCMRRSGVAGLGARGEKKGRGGMFGETVAADRVI